MYNKTSNFKVLKVSNFRRVQIMTEMVANISTLWTNSAKTKTKSIGSSFKNVSKMCFENEITIAY